PLAAEDLARSRPVGVDERVGVSLQDVAPAADPDDPVQDGRAEVTVLVGDDLADAVARGTVCEDEVSLVQARLHAHAVDDGVGRRAAEPRRREEGPCGGAGRECDACAGDAENAVPRHRPPNAGTATSPAAAPRAGRSLLGDD